jgi:hypothetical protein
MEDAHACPACGRGIDPLRAGEVAFVDGHFLYFCDRSHKTQWLATHGAGVSHDVTADPPAVEPVETAERPEPAPEPREEEPRSMPIRRWASTDDVPVSIRTEPTVRAWRTSA